MTWLRRFVPPGPVKLSTPVAMEKLVVSMGMLKKNSTELIGTSAWPEGVLESTLGSVGSGTS